MSIDPEINRLSAEVERLRADLDQTQRQLCAAMTDSEDARAERDSLRSVLKNHYCTCPGDESCKQWTEALKGE